MTRNIGIAAVFTLLTAVLLAGIFLREKPRLEEATGAITAERVERGARDYEQYCATCHGLAGQGGVGPRINNIEARYYSPDPQGNVPAKVQYGIEEKYGTLRNYIEATLVSGIRNAPMPAFGAQGILRDDQIENITSYVLSWNSTYTDTDDVYRGLPTGVAARANLEATRSAPTPDPNANPVDAGGLAFRGQCAGCHAMTDQTLVGPGLGGLFSPEGTAAFGTKLPNNRDVSEDNVREWIRGGTAGFTENIPDVTGNHYPSGMPGIQLSDEDMNNVIIWLRVHNRDGTETAEADQIRQQGTQGQPGDENNLPGNQNVPTVIPTGQAQPNSGPESQQMPTSQVNTDADAESTGATSEALEEGTTTAPDPQETMTP